MEGRLLEVLEKSELEKRDPLCSIFPSCGGCMYRDYALRRAAENERRADQKLFDDAVDYEYTFEPIKGSPIEFAYRNKMEFSLGMNTKTGHCHLDFIKRQHI